MKKAFTAAVLVLTSLSAPAFADVYTVDFSMVTPGTDLTLPGATIDGVQFSYDNLGSTLGDTAAADTNGIYGSTWGDLIIQFGSAIYGGLRLDYSIDNVIAGDIGGNAMIAFYSGGLAGTWVDTVSNDATFIPYGDESGFGTAFVIAMFDLGSYAGGGDTAVINFSPVANPPSGDDHTYNPYQFNVTDITYGTDLSDSTDFTPEPGTWVLLVSGVIAIGFGSHKRKSVRV